MAPADRKRRSARPRTATWLWRALTAGGIALSGFAIGLVAGSVLEGPRLVIDWIRGPAKSVEIALVDPSPVDSGPLSGVTDLHQPSRIKAARRAERQVPMVPATPQRTAETPQSGPPRPPKTAEARPHAQPPASAAPAASARAPAAAPAPRGTPVVQVASTRDPAEARRIAARLRSGGFDAYQVAVSPNGTTTHRVRVRTRRGETAAELADRLKAQGFETWVTTE